MPIGSVPERKGTECDSRFLPQWCSTSWGQELGQAFAEEVFRVWPGEHREVTIRPQNMAPAVEFMVKRAQRERSSPKRLGPGTPTGSGRTREHCAAPKTQVPGAEQGHA